MVATTMTSGQMKRIIEILTSTVPNNLSFERAQDLIDSDLRPHLVNFWSAAARKDDVYEVIPLYSFGELSRQFEGIFPNHACKAMEFPKPRGVKPVRLKVLKHVDLGDESFEDFPFMQLAKTLRKIDIKVASAPEMLGFLAQECVNPSDNLNESVIALGGDAIMDPLSPPSKNLSFLSASRTVIGQLTNRIHCGLFPAEASGLENWGLNLLVHA